MMLMLFKLGGDLLWCPMGGKQFHWYKVETTVCSLFIAHFQMLHTSKQKSTVLRYSGCLVHRACSAHEHGDT